MVKDCCQNPRNLYRAWWIRPFRFDITVRKCRVCQCRHIEMKVKRGVVGVRGMAVGGKT